MKAVSLFLAWMLVAVGAAAAAADPSPRATAQAAVAAPQNLVLASWASLANAAATSGTYTLAPSFSMSGYSGGNGLQLASGVAVTVLGQGAVLDASSKGRFFTIAQGASLTLKDLTLQNGEAVSGRRSVHAALAFAARATLTSAVGAFSG
jgi:hypothetical protein